MIKLTTIGFATCFVLSVCLSTGQALSQKTTYYQGTSWTIQMVKKGTGNTSSDRAYCEVKTTSFEPRSVAIQSSPSKEAGMYRTVIKLRKLGWQLPIGASAKVKVGNLFRVEANQIVEAPPMVFKVESADSMASLLADYEPSLQSEMANAVLNGIFVRTKYGSTLWFQFIDGNEPEWNPASVEKFEQKISFKAYEQCLSDLSQMAANSAGGGSMPLSRTSPLTPSSGVDAKQFSASPTVNRLPVDPPEGTAPSALWHFSIEEEDWGETCYAETQKGDVKVGFMGSPSKHLVAFVEGVFKGETRATWHVDDKPAYVSDGSENDYFGWHEFGQLPMDLLDQVSQGKELAVTGAKGERVVVDLKGAAEAVSKLKGCFKKT
ncbi:hypothetical protein ACC786_20825 [Rhizobium ruizarguesonis]|uniref:hypothetical protein n=1 Tax=Rhizobium ruizarguesonis TaxID=2081791 RepID=UPI001030A576|nr:hypothetical protein [Rhizobium ruizarguesonis]TAY91933.1 hypothetical protein ELH85_01330 [Rhizobium ruizarguesonis]